MIELVSNDRIDTLIKPITEAAPTGEDPKYASEFEFVKAETTKTSERDFDKICESCETILTTQAKDLTTLGYFLQAAAVSRGWEECADVATAYALLMDQYWDQVHPIRERARENTIKWLSEERVIGTLNQVASSDSDFEHLQRALDAVTRIREILQERLPDNPPSIKPLFQFFTELCKKHKPQEKPKAAEAPKETTAAPPSAKPATPAAPAVSGGTAEIGGTKSDVQKTIQKVALHLISQEAESPIGYKLLRVNRWLEIQGPPKEEAGNTPFAPPNAQRMSYLDGLYQQQNWAAILEKSETAFTEPGFHFWLDLQFYACQALDGRGYKACSDAIKLELGALLKRVPTLKGLKFSDGTPFANVQTQAWLEGITLGSSGAGLISKAVQTRELSDDLEQANELAQAGKLEEAIVLLQSGLSFGSARQKTEREMSIAELALRSGKAKVAYMLSDQLCDKISLYKLEQWDPELCVEIWKINYKSAKGLIDSGELAETTAMETSLQRSSKQLSFFEPSFLIQMNY